MRNLGLCYANGTGTRPDGAEAVRWLESAFEGGADAATVDLGEIYMKGESVRKDQKQATQWFRRAYEAGNAAAMSDLGLAYCEGIGVAPNPVEGSNGCGWQRKTEICRQCGTWQ